MAAPRLLLLLAAALGAPLLAQSGDQLLAAVDQLRHPWPAFQVEVSLTAKGATQRWRVTARENGDARVEGLSEKEKGRTVLVLGDEMWLLLPTAKRPVRVTPQQRMMGPAAGGDIARTRFSTDYSVAGQEADTWEGQSCWRLELAAKRPTHAFRSAHLWVSKARSHPLFARFFLPSGKVAKEATFAPPGLHGEKPVLGKMIVREPRSPESVDLEFRGWTPVRPDPKAFQLPELGH